MRKLLLALIIFTSIAAADDICGPNGTFRGLGNAGDILCTGKVGTSGYPQAFTGVTTVTVLAADHGQGTKPTGYCYDDGTPAANAIPLTAGYPHLAANGDITYAWTGTKNGTCITSALGTFQGTQGPIGASGLGWVYRGVYASRPVSPLVNDTMIFTDAKVPWYCTASNFGTGGTGYAECRWNGTTFTASSVGVDTNGNFVLPNALVTGGPATLSGPPVTLVKDVAANLPACGSDYTSYLATDTFEYTECNPTTQTRSPVLNAGHNFVRIFNLTTLKEECYGGVLDSAVPCDSSPAISSSGNGTTVCTSTVAGRPVSGNVLVGDANGNCVDSQVALSFLLANLAPVITTASLTSATDATAYTQTLAATGGTAPYTWSCPATCALPTGLSLNASTGAITGSPSTGTATVAFRVTDANTNTRDKSLAINVNVKTPTANNATGTYNNAVSVTWTGPTSGSTITTCSDVADCTPGSATNPVSVTVDGTHVCATAAKTGYVAATKCETYTLTVATPTASPDNSNATITSGTTETWASSTTSATFHYTVDGTTPTCSTGTTGSSVAPTTTTTYKVVGCKASYNDSAVKTITYTVSGGAVPSITQSKGNCGSSSNLTSYTCAYTTNVTSGNVLLVIEQIVQTTADSAFIAPTATCVGGGTTNFTQIGSTVSHPVVGMRASAWKATADSTASCTVTMTNTHSNTITSFISAVVALSAGAVLDANCSGTTNLGTTGTCATGMTLTGGSGDLVIAFAGASSTEDWTVGGTYTVGVGTKNATTNCTNTSTTVSTCFGLTETNAPVVSSPENPTVTALASSRIIFIGTAWK